MVTMASSVDIASVQFENAAAPLVKSLTEAISDGDLIKARQFAAELAKMKAKLDLIRVANIKPEQIIIDVVVQRLGLERATIRLHVTTNWTFRHLQQLVEQNHGIPTQMQKWIVQRQFPRDDATLTSVGVKTGSVLGLYVRSDRFAKSDERESKVREMIPTEMDGFVREREPQVPLLRPVVNPRLVASPPPDVVGLLGRDPTNAVAPVAPEPIQWGCTGCTYMNEATRPSCEMCGTDRPQNFVVPPDHQPSKVERDRMEEEAKMTTLFQQAQKREDIERQRYIAENLTQIALGDESHFIPNDEEFECPVCFTEVAPREGVVLRNCVHEFCIPCLEQTIKQSEGPDVKCPFADQEYQCDAPIQDREIAAIVNQEDYDKYLARSLRIAEGREKNSFHCLTPNCIGWCIYEDEENFFECLVCKARNCLTCKAQHGNQNCQEYQDGLRRQAEVNVELNATLQGIQEMLRTGEAMNCPSCGVLLQKKEGCDWMRCSMCLTELCWATRGPRWGPQGNGDTTGGCKCSIRKMCHPSCQNCH